MRALVWIIEDTWQATVDDAAAFLPRDAEITLLHVASTEPETVAFAARRGLLGRHPPREQSSRASGNLSNIRGGGFLQAEVGAASAGDP
jgi:hypothetical protein